MFWGVLILCMMPALSDLTVEIHLSVPSVANAVANTKHIFLPQLICFWEFYATCWVSPNRLICQEVYWRTGFSKVIAICLHKPLSRSDKSGVKLDFGIFFAIKNYFEQKSIQGFDCHLALKFVTLYWNAPISDIRELAFLNIWGRTNWNMIFKLKYFIFWIEMENFQYVCALDSSSTSSTSENYFYFPKIWKF